MANYVKHTNSVTDKTLKDFIFEVFKISSETELQKLEMSYVKILNFTIPGESRNSQVIESFYNDSEKKDNIGKTEDKLIKVGTILNFPKVLESSVLKEIHSKVEVNNEIDKYIDFNSFLSEKINNIIKDERYAPRKTISTTFNNRDYKVTASNVEISVFVWSRALNKVLNLSPFIMSMSTSVGQNGGNFNLLLPPITIPEEQSKEMGNIVFEWDTLTQNFVLFQKNGRMNYTFRDTVSFVGNITTEGKSSLNNTNSMDYTEIMNSTRILDRNFLFNLLISPQDMIFIKFERLLFDGENDTKDFKQFDILSLKDMEGQIWDMMGLVDSVAMNRDEMSNDYSISLSGRDLTKLIIQDGVYLYPLTNVDFQKQFVANSEAISNDVNYDRLFGEVQDLALHLQQPLRIPLEYIFEKFSKIEVIPDNQLTFLSDPDALNKRGVWKYTNLSIDSTVSNRNIVDSSLATDSGSLINFIKKICQMPFVEFFSDTYGDRFYWVVRKPPFSKKSFLSNYTLNVERKNLLNFEVGFKDEKVYSWYRLLPMGNYFGDQEFSKFYLPAIYFPQYASIWGANPLEITSNYLYFGISDEESTLEKGYKQALEDLKFIIQTNAYNPFVREGTMSIEGDRRFKYGMNVYNNSTDELFYVTGVTQTYDVGDTSVNRMTTLSIEKGMVLSHIDKYFDVIDLPDPDDNIVFTRQLKWKVNEEIFDFLLKRKQFYKNLKEGQ